jgi:deoxyribonuclease IV
MKKSNKLYLGAHVSIAGGVYNCFATAEMLGCDTIQIFVKSSSQWESKPLSINDIEKFHEEQRRTGITPVIAHAAYLSNLASPNPELLTKSREAFLEEINRCDRLEIPNIVIHPGSHKDSGEQTGIDTIIDSINWLVDHTPDYRVKITLETTAGQGASLGHRFEHFAEIIDRVDDPDRLAVCFDTCHVFVAGYNLATSEGFTQTWADFERIIGIDKLAVIHLNDTGKGLGSKVDRHEHIGQGQIGQRAFRLMMQDKRFRKIPKILETPKGEDGRMDLANLALLKKFASQKNKSFDY